MLSGRTGISLVVMLFECENGMQNAPVKSHLSSSVHTGRDIPSHSGNNVRDDGY